MLVTFLLEKSPRVDSACADCSVVLVLDAAVSGSQLPASVPELSFASWGLRNLLAFGAHNCPTTRGRMGCRARVFAPQGNRRSL